MSTALLIPSSSCSCACKVTTCSFHKLIHLKEQRAFVCILPSLQTRQIVIILLHVYCHTVHSAHRNKLLLVAGLQGVLVHTHQRNKQQACSGGICRCNSQAIRISTSFGSPLSGICCAAQPKQAKVAAQGLRVDADSCQQHCVAIPAHLDTAPSSGQTAAPSADQPAAQLQAGTCMPARLQPHLGPAALCLK